MRKIVKNKREIDAKYFPVVTVVCIFLVNRWQNTSKNCTLIDRHAFLPTWVGIDNKMICSSFVTISKHDDNSLEKTHCTVILVQNFPFCFKKWGNTVFARCWRMLWCHFRLTTLTFMTDYKCTIVSCILNLTCHVFEVTVLELVDTWSFPANDG